MPGFWVCLLVTALVVAPLAAALMGRSPLSVFSSPEDPAWRYPFVNAALPIFQYPIAGLETPRGETAMDGSLWTLQYEAFCYFVLALLGMATLLRRRLVLVMLCAVLWVLTWVQFAGLIPFDVPLLQNDQVLRFLLMFLLGAAGHVLGDRIPISWHWATAAGAVVLASTFMLPDYRLVGALAFAYLCLYAMVRLPLWRAPAWDLSYGLYLYHWPVQFLLALAGATALGQPAFVLLSVCLALGVAALSWVTVESRALRLKDMPVPSILPARVRSSLRETDPA